MAWYTGIIYRGVDYNPTWPGWTQGPGANDVNQRLQTFDSDIANDAFASLWGSAYQASPAGDSPFSVPVNNGSNYRDDLGTIAKDGFNLVRLYNWDVARGTSPSQHNIGLDHINFLDYAASLGLKIVVPVSDFFLNDTEFSWNGVTPDSNYSFSSAPAAIQDDFKQFIASITDPRTGKIHSAVLLSVGNEGDIGEDLQASHTTASNFLARTNWWIYNLHQQINGTGVTGPDGDPVVNGPGSIVPISATFANADQGGTNGSWFKALLSGAQAGQATPNTWVPTGGTTFTAQVKGLAAADPGFESYYYNSFNIGQSTTTPPFGNGIAATLALYDSGTSPWPGAKFNVPLLLMEVFTPNRSQYPTQADQALASVNEAKDIEAYLALHNAGTPSSTTNLMGYNYFEFNDEPNASKQVGLYQYGMDFKDAQTGTSGIFYIDRGGFADFTFPVYALTPTPGPDGQGTLVGAWTGTFRHAFQTHNDAYVIVQGQTLTMAASDGVLANDTTSSGSPVIGALAQLTRDATAGMLHLNSDGGFSYSPTAGFSGVDNFTYKASAGSAEAQIYVVPVVVGASATLNWFALTPDQQIAADYIAYLGRAPDADGFHFWEDLYNSYSRSFEPFFGQFGAALAGLAIAGAISSSTESQAFNPLLANPHGASDAEIEAFLNSEYNILFHRSPDAEGLAYWTRQIKATLAADQPIGLYPVAMMFGAQGQDITTLMSKVAVSLAYVNDQQQFGTQWAGASDVAIAMALVDAVTSDPQTLLIGIAKADALIASHP